ncbi:MAG: phosphotransferase family protein [Hyphomonadaceae bacterium]|nr:phosphotransferase family protein [Hyphomonadaceae bacterium]
MMDQADLEKVLRRRLPGFEKLVTCERLSSGASRETYRLVTQVNGRERLMALRWSPDNGRSALGQGPGLEVEARLFAAALRARVPGPEVFLVLEPGDGLGSGFVMEWIEGETLGAKIARSGEFADTRKTLAFQCGEILARLHSIDIDEEHLDGDLESFTPEHAVRKTHAAYLEFETPQPMIDFTAKWLLDNLPKKRKLSLVHSDFRSGNLMVHPKKGVVAVLDWELAHIGDPMRDLGWICTRSWRFGVADKPVGGFGDYNDLFKGYASVTGHRVDEEAVRFWEVFGSFWWAVGCLSMAQSWRDGQEKSLERPVIGRRSSECQIDCVNMLIPDWGRNSGSVVRTLSTTELPRSDELLIGVRDFLRNDVASKLQGRDSFLARVAANSIDIVLRELELGADAELWERQALHALLGRVEGRTTDLRAALCAKIRAEDIDLRRPDLHAYLRDSVLSQVMIDQPGYPGALECMNR